MKATVLSETLQKKLSFANKAISSRNQLPILSHVLLEVKNENLMISSTDLEIGIEVQLSAAVEEEGAITVPAKLFLELISSLPQDKITLQTIEQKLEITSRKMRSVLATTPKDEFPLLFEEKGEELFTIPKGSMKDMFGKVIFAASTELTRPALSGILLQTKGENINIVATDGYRLSFDQKILHLEKTIEKLIIPFRLLREASFLSEEGDTHLFALQKSNQILFQTEETILVGRMIEAEFPSYEKVIPTDQSSLVTFDREELLRAVKTCSIFAKESANIITLSLQKEAVVVSAKTPSLGENTVAVDGRLTGEENDIAFNARYLLEALTSIPENELTFSMTGPLNPGVFRIAGNHHFLHLIMPIRV